MHNGVFSAFNVIGFILCSVPLYWHLEAWNVGTCMFIIWTAVNCLIQLVNSILWNGNVVNWAPVWCDISTRVVSAFTIAIPACTLCINRRLYLIASSSSVNIGTRQEKRRSMIVDLIITLGIPLLSMITQYIVSGHRYDIYEDYGCMAEVYNSWPAYPLVLLWPLIIGCVSAVYCTLTIMAFMKRRKMFRELVAVNSNITYSRYFRLIALAGTELLISVPSSTWITVVSITSGHGLYPWISWTDTHFGYSRYYQIPRSQYSTSNVSLAIFELERWTPVICAILFFIFFGFADEAKKHYRQAFGTISKAIGYGTLFSTAPSTSASSTFPRVRGNTSFVGGISVSSQTVCLREKAYSRDSLSSTSDKFSTSIYIDEADCRTPDIYVQPSETGFVVTPVSLSSKEAEAALRVPEPARRKPSVPDAPKSVYPDSVFDV